MSITQVLDDLGQAPRTLWCAQAHHPAPLHPVHTNKVSNSAAFGPNATQYAAA